MSLGQDYYFIAIKDIDGIPDKIKKILDSMKLDKMDIFGSSCYCIIGDDNKTPLNNLEDEDLDIFWNWLDMNANNQDHRVFYYYWE